MDLKNPPERYWHCLVEVPGRKKGAIVNDLTFDELDRAVIQPWLADRPSQFHSHTCLSDIKYRIDAIQLSL